MTLYQTVQINPHSYYINDEDLDSCYLIIGSQKALLIDLGLFKKPILPTIRSLANLPVVAACTHGHLDHTGAMKEFDEIYLSYLDKQVYLDNQKLMPDFPLIDFSQIKDIQDHQLFDIGNHHIEAILLAGHTPGSMIFLDYEHHCLYSGDAIGSGCGVWMQLYHSLPIKDYLANLDKVIAYLESKGVDNTWKFWGGHNQQETMSKVSSYNQLDLNLMKDLSSLCKQLLDGKIEGVENSAPTFDDQQAYYVAYRKAEMIYQKNSLK